MSLIKLNNNGVKNITSVGSVGTGDLKFISSSLPNITYTVTVADSGGNKYFIDGVAQDTLSLYRGGTYTFDQSHSSNSGHPLRLSSTSNGTHGGGSEFTTGVTTTGTAGSAGAKTVITVPQDAPTLYYYCTNHSGMGGTANISGVSNISFTSGIDSTYKEYVFYFVNMHPSSGGNNFTFQADTGTNTNYNQTITSTSFRAFQVEDASVNSFGYRTGEDLAQSTSFQQLQMSLGNDNDQSAIGILQVFNPSSSVFVKHFLATTQTSRYNVGGTANGTGSTYNSYIAGYFNTQTPLTRFQFKMSSGNIDSGEILLYGVN